MSEWIAISYGALDVSNRDDFQENVEVLIVPAVPGSPIGISGEVAHFWRRLVDGPVSDEVLTENERYLISEFEKSGIASTLLEHPARVTQLPEPWLYSPMHELVNGLAVSVARDAGIEVVVFKGPLLTLQGLSEKVHSGDVDLWVDPSKMVALEGEMAKWGWSHLEVFWQDTDVQHSATLDPGDWGCQIDLHRFFPGVGLPGLQALKLIQKESIEVHFASVTARCPPKVIHAALSALHIMRPGVRTVVSDAAIDRAAEVLRRAGKDVIDAGRRLNAMAPLDPALRRAFPDEDFGDPGALPENWIWRSRGNLLSAYLAAIKTLPWNMRLKYLFRMLWPTDRVALDSEVWAGGHSTNPTKAKIKRLARGLRMLLSRS